ncbi:MAG TPA: TAXI family TRAP transporter solute-binding subunit, partial [Verrucomicrobiae bacterium]|nr:TAXI family TRAP transporter solute-binding subunit [Verrucomicrobiae bacterium]
MLRLTSIFSEYFGLNRLLSFLTVCLIGAVICSGIFWFIYSAPPKVITITSGPAGSPFESNATKYGGYLHSNGVSLKILPSQGSLENLDRLTNPAEKADIGFVQGGIADQMTAHKLVSLGSVGYEPLLVFYRGTNSVTMLSQFEGKRLAIGSEGSGTHALALMLLQTNGIAPGGTTELENLNGAGAADALLAGKVDAVFLMTDSASIQTIRTLLRSPGVQLMSFEQADAYTRRFNFLNKLLLPEGSLDLGKNLPAHDVWLIGPTVELVARPGLNSAISDLVLEAATVAHKNAGIFQNQGEFPAPLAHEFAISQDAQRYYKSGRKGLYNFLPFWIASLANRIAIAFVPVLLLLVPGFKLIPALYRWRSQLRINRWYRKLLVLEREVVMDSSHAQEGDHLQRLNEIETVVRQMKVPASFANLYYSLRQH